MHPLVSQGPVLPIGARQGLLAGHAAAGCSPPLPFLPPLCWLSLSQKDAFKALFTFKDPCMQPIALLYLHFNNVLL